MFSKNRFLLFKGNSDEGIRSEHLEKIPAYYSGVHMDRFSKARDVESLGAYRSSRLKNSAVRSIVLEVDGGMKVRERALSYGE